MKKLMIAAAIVCAAAFAHAGAYTWGLTGGEDMNHAGTYIVNEAGGVADVPFTAMLFLGTIGQTLNADGTYALNFSQATFVAQTSAVTPGDYTIGEFKFDAGRTSASVDGTAQAFSILMLDTGAGITDYQNYKGTYAVVAGTGTVGQDPDTSTYYTQFTALNSIGASDYRTAAAVPEPTSGLLLLLGVAGLALKRKRA